MSYCGWARCCPCPWDELGGFCSILEVCSSAPTCLFPTLAKPFSQEEPMASFSRLCGSCARVLYSLVVEPRSSITSASEADGPTNSWQLG